MYFYWFAFPAFVTKAAWEIDSEWGAAEEVLGADTVRLRSSFPYSPSFLSLSHRVA